MIRLHYSENNLNLDYLLGNTQKSSQVAGVMSRKRKIHESAIERFQLKTETELKESIEKNSKKSKVEEQSSETAGDSATQEDIR